MTDVVLLSDATRQRLLPLMLSPRKTRSSGMKGERRSSKRGTSVEFADYRNYVAGDDLRKLDWNVFARLNRPTIKLYEDEEDLTVHLLLDNSASMGMLSETADETHDKWLFARRLGAALGFVALGGNDRLIVSPLAQTTAPFNGRGRVQTVGMMRYLLDCQIQGHMDLNARLKEYALRERRAGMCFIISDLFSPSGYLDGMSALLSKGYEITLLHTLSPEEMNPSLVGDLRLVDVETNTTQEVTIDADLRARYQQALQAWLAQIRADCARRGIVYVPITTDTSPEQVILYDLRRQGVVR